MTDNSPRILRYLTAVHVLSVLAVPLVDYAMGVPWPFIAVQAALLVGGSASYAATVLVLTTVLMLVAPILFAAASPEAFVLAHAAINGVLAALFVARASLTRPFEKLDTAWSVHAYRWLTAWAFVMTTALLFRSVPFVATAIWAGLLWALRHHMAAIPRRPAFNPRGLAVNTVLTIVAIVVSLGAIEAGVRLIVPPEYTERLYEADPITLSRLIPNSKGHFVVALNEEKTEKRVTKIKISSQGIRDRAFGAKQPGEFRVLMIGDSFTMGSGLHLEETYAKRLETRLRERPLGKTISVINAGIGGHAPWQERRVLAELGFGFEPDLVIHQLFPGNDIEGSLEQIDKYLIAYNAEWKKNYLSFKDRSHWQAQTEHWVRGRSRAYWLLTRLTEDQYSIRDTLRELRLFPTYELPRLRNSAPRHFNLEPNLVDTYDDLEEGWTLLEDAVKGTYEDCVARGVDYWLFCVPQDIVGIDALWETVFAGEEARAVYERDKAQDRIAAFCKRESIPYVDVLPALRGYDGPEEVYFRYDGHFTPTGADLVAQVLEENLLRHYYPTEYTGEFPAND